MKFQSWDLGYLKGSEIALVTLKGNAANVKLMDSSNFQNYRNGRPHRYHGGHATSSPVRLPVPNSGHWYITIDFGGYSGQTNASVEVLPGRLPTYQEPSLTSVPSLRLGQNQEDNPYELSDEEREYDVFISHASEDKIEIVNPLVTSLQELGLKVWYDDFELRIGDSLRRKIDKGVANSRFGVVVLSQPFFKKGWTNYELDGIVTRSITGEQIILPIWHNISKKEVINYSPSLADKLARSTSTHTIEEIAEEIAQVIKGY